MKNKIINYASKSIKVRESLIVFVSLSVLAAIVLMAGLALLVFNWNVLILIILVLIVILMAALLMRSFADLKQNVYNLEFDLNHKPKVRYNDSQLEHDYYA